MRKESALARTEPPAPPNDGPSPTPPPRHTKAIVVSLDGPIARDAAATLCAQLRARLAMAGPREIACHVEAVEMPDLSIVDALARLTLTARRFGVSVEVVGSTVALADLVALVGLSDVILIVPVQSRRGGRPNSGKNVSVSRKNVIPAIPSADRSST
jgi:ABC-type transporter Mla MlaB component